MQDLVIFGTGGFAREVQGLVEDLNAATPSFNFLGYLDDAADRHGQRVHGHPVLGGADWIEGRDAQVVIGVGNTAARRRIAARLEEKGARFATLVHPGARVGRRVTVGEGSVLCAGVLTTVDITLGRHVILNLATTVGHDSALEDFVTTAPSVNVSGAVRVGQGCDLGTGSTIIQGLELGAWSVVGAGAAVVRSLPANVTAVGVPARVIKQRDDGWHI